MRKTDRSHNLILKDNRGETLVEILVAFMVLTIVLAMFTGAITSASSAGNNSISKRRTSDEEYNNLNQMILTEEFSGIAGDKSTGEKKQVTIQGGDPSVTYTLTAYKYKSGETIYWVFR